jgi:hypothetical protein
MQETKEFKKKRLTKQETIEFLDKNKNLLFNLIEKNVSYRQIAEKFDLHLTNLHYYLNLEENQQTKEHALKVSSYEVLEQAEEELHKIKDDSTNATVRRQSELYQHRLYLAKIKNRKEFDLNYRENQDINNTQQIVVIPANFTKNIDNQNNNNNNNSIIE